MTPEAFAAWEEACRKAGLIRVHGARRDLARLLDVTEDTVRRWRQDGTSSRMADLACAAILAGLLPHGDGDRPEAALPDQSPAA